MTVYLTSCFSFWREPFSIKIFREPVLAKTHSGKPPARNCLILSGDLRGREKTTQELADRLIADRLIADRLIADRLISDRLGSAASDPARGKGWLSLAVGPRSREDQQEDISVASIERIGLNQAGSG
jgi:hypothetical protein